MRRPQPAGGFDRSKPQLAWAAALARDFCSPSTLRVSSATRSVSRRIWSWLGMPRRLTTLARRPSTSPCTRSNALVARFFAASSCFLPCVTFFLPSASTFRPRVTRRSKRRPPSSCDSAAAPRPARKTWWAESATSSSCFLTCVRRGSVAMGSLLVMMDGGPRRLAGTRQVYTALRHCQSVYAALRQEPREGFRRGLAFHAASALLSAARTSNQGEELPMRPSLRSGLSTACLCLLALPAAAAIRTEGAQVRVNKNTDFQQKNPAAAFASNGTSVVAWENDQRGIRAQFYKVSGMPSGDEVTLVGNPDLPPLPFAATLLNRRDPALAYGPNGHLLVAWTEERAFVRSTPFAESRRVDDQDVMVQRFSGSGSPMGDRFRVNADSTGLQHTPRLVAKPGGFFAVWEDGATGSIVGRALDPNGRPVGDDIAAGEASGQLRPALASNGRNRILVTWDAPDSHQLGVFGRLLDNSGEPQGAAFRISTTTAYRQARPTVAAGDGR